MGIGFVHFAIGEYENIHPEIDKIFRVEELIKKTKELNGASNEKELHVISNPLNLSRILTYYGKG